MKFCNLTPHKVVVANGALRITIERNPEDPIVRVERNVVQQTVHYEVTPGVRVSIPLQSNISYDVIGLPDPVPGVTYIVSSMVASRVKRIDVVAPLTDATCERDESGRVMSVKGFQTYTADYAKRVTVTPEEGKVEEVFEEAVLETIEEVESETIEEPAFEGLKFDETLLDPIKAAALMVDHHKLAAKAKYEKRKARASRS